MAADGPSVAIGMTIGLMGGMLFAIVATPPSSDIGVRFDNLGEAQLRRDFGRLSKGQIDEAIGKAVANFMEKGATEPVIIHLPPRTTGTTVPVQRP